MSDTGPSPHLHWIEPSSLVRGSHASRFRLARELVMPFAGRRLLDYGCGDGSFLALVADLFPQSLGVDIATERLEECARKFAGQPGITFLSTARLNGPKYRDHYEIVVCTDVLEHCPDDYQVAVLQQIVRVTAPGGTVVVSVPIEVGPALLAKHGARTLLSVGGLRKTGRERYRPGELVHMVFAGENTAIPRREYVGNFGTRFTGHKGFNWRRLQRMIEAELEIERRLFSPLPILGSWLNDQVWFVCRKPPVS